MKVPQLSRRAEVSLLFLTGLIACAVVALFLSRPKPPIATITSYAQCAEAGYPIQDSYPPACRANGHLYVGPTSTPEPSTVPAVTVESELLVKGDSGGAYPAKQEVITTQVDWVHYWTQVHRGQPQIPPILPVDFEDSNVVAISLGQKSSGGYTIKLDSIQQTATGTSIAIMQTSPGEHCMVTQSFTNPYLIMQTPVLTEPVSFRITNTKRAC